MIKKQSFGKTPEGREVFTYALDNGCGVIPVVSDYGATLVKLFANDKDGDPVDVICGFDSVDGYIRASGYQGATVGRVCNRIGGAKFTLNGVEYRLFANDGEHSLHGGRVGLDKRVWEVVETSDGDEPFISFRYISPDMEENFPGELTVTVTYSLTKDKGLSIRYEAQTDKDTIVNLTNHSYFNLAGCGVGTIKDQVMWIDADKINETDGALIPTGKFINVKGGAYDFNEPKPIGRDLDSAKVCGYDDNFIINNYDGTVKLAATLENPANGLKMSVYSDKPCIQIYTANMIDEDDVHFKGDRPQRKYCAVCFETQHMPDSINHTNFTNTVLKPGGKYDYTTVYKFDT